MKKLDFFLTDEDWKDVLREIAAVRVLKYTEIASQSGPDFLSLNSDELICSLDQPAAEQTSLCAYYLVTDAGQGVNSRKVDLRNGGSRFYLDQAVNPNSVVFVPAGKRNPSIIIAGRLATISDTPDSLDIFKLMARIIKKYSTRIRQSWVGREAKSILDEGGRLTHAVQSPKEFDLQYEVNKLDRLL